MDGLPSVAVLYPVTTSLTILCGRQVGSLWLQRLMMRRRSGFAMCSSLSLLRYNPPHFPSAKDAISKNVGALRYPRDGSYSFQFTPCCSTVSPVSMEAKAGSVRLGEIV